MTTCGTAWPHTSSAPDRDQSIRLAPADPRTPRTGPHMYGDHRAGEMHGHAADRGIHPSPGVGDARGLVRPQQVLVQPAAAPLSHQPSEAGLLPSVADGLAGGAHTPAVLIADRRLGGGGWRRAEAAVMAVAAPAWLA